MALPRREKIGGVVQRRSDQVGWRFDSKNEMAQAYASRQAARYVTRVSAETKAGLQGIIAKSVREGINARDTAKLIRSSVGLNGPQGAAVNNYYNNLIARGTDTGRAWKLADKYSDKLLKVRAKTIARTEIMGALNGGALEQARQRRDAGLFLNPMKKWKITKDEVTCRICRPLEGQVRPLEVAFSTGVLTPPTHPNCRCTLSFFDAVDAVAEDRAIADRADVFANAHGDARLNMSKQRGHTDVPLSQALDERNAHMISYDGHITRGGQRIHLRVVTTNQDNQDRSFRRVLGHRVSLREKLSAIGFHIPKGARSISITGGGEDIKVKILGESGFHDSIQMSRMWFASRSGKLYQENSYFGVKGAFARKGYAREVMRRSITGASEIGISTLTTEAMGNLSQAVKGSWNGYYTWPRLGFAKKVPSLTTSIDLRAEHYATTENLRLGLKQGTVSQREFDKYSRWNDEAKDFPIKKRIEGELRRIGIDPDKEVDVSELMKSETGRSLWKVYGSEANMDFDLSPGSRSRMGLEAYLAAKK